MAQATVAAIEAARQRQEALDKLKRERSETAQRLDELDRAIGEVEDSDFHERLGKTPLSRMHWREKAETAARLGPERFRAAGARRAVVPMGGPFDELRAAKFRGS